MTKIICFSDTHMSHDDVKLPKGDILIFCGDFSGDSTIQDIIVFNKFLIDNKDKYKDILLVYGNHEIPSEENPDASRGLLSGCQTLTNEGVTINGVKFFGSPYTPRFYDWAFMKKETDLVDVYAQIPDDTDVVITHGPPYGILDKNSHGDHCGSMVLRERINEIKPRFHLFGHIHQSYGIEKSAGTTYVNCSVLDDWYALKNKPVVLKI